MHGFDYLLILLPVLEKTIKIILVKADQLSVYSNGFAVAAAQGNTRMSLLNRTKLALNDLARHHAASRLVLSHLVEKVDQIRPAEDVSGKTRSLNRLTLAARLGSGQRSLLGVESRLRQRLDEWNPAGFQWDQFLPGSQPRTVRKSIILKTPQANGEKGVLFVSFEDNWLRLLRHANVAKLARDYHLIISPTWSPPHDLPLLLAVKLWPGVLFTTISSIDDLPVFARISPQIITIPLLSSSWVNPAVFAPDPTQAKKYDIAMVANFALYKRHFALFRALREMSRDTKVVLMGRGWDGRTKDDLEKEASWFGVKDRLTILEGPPDPEMVRTLCSSKVSVIMSKGEGSCVAIAESLFVDVPVGLLEDANVGSRVFINAQTGRFLRPRHLAEDLTKLIQDYRQFHPREWMLENGKSYRESSDTLNRALKSWSSQQGEPWTVDLMPFHWRPTARYLTLEEARSMDGEYQRFEREYGVPVESQDLAYPTA